MNGVKKIPDSSFVFLGRVQCGNACASPPGVPRSCMYGLSSRYSEFAVDLFEPAILPEQRYCRHIAEE